MTTTSLIDNLEKLLGGPRDGALLRYSLGSEHLRAGNPAQAAVCLREAVERDGNHSAAWKLLGRALSESNQPGEALAAYEEGIAVAKRRGDVQAAKEMLVFARRLRRQLAATEDQAATASPP
ncbi:MAG TPA: tetratricopeptide repeat protein [Candidatus Accumulibacter phosphatis]|nr:MAG: type IV pilus biogenesis/stability protein PilW [Candidatus Accumulibacter sp. SK-11]HAY27780.1 tetratricopeptide repeat protein [Accumulibacter sp.]HRL74908.1 tetratricopeptide repeat protein [Candidatus Accumulibacter phosphatis]HCN70166.1 tetratricopeptide repeat protein [Accumulibacter sp.]HCV14562.1 tetratricopeptide repeat protein [Accumulibacter sp.]